MKGRRKDLANRKVRRRDQAALDTIEGKQITAEIYQFLLEDKARRPGWFRAQFPPPWKEIEWSAKLPGYEQAIESCIGALFHMQARSKLYRQWWIENKGRPDPVSLTFQALSYGMGNEQFGYSFLTSVPVADPLQHSRRINKAISAGRKRAVKPRCLLFNPDSSMAALNSVVFGEMQESYRLWLPGLWTLIGLWMANSEDAMGFFRSPTDNSTISDLPVPEPNTYHKWTRELGLYHYKGRGRVIYDAGGVPRGDFTLLCEAGIEGPKRSTR